MHVPAEDSGASVRDNNFAVFALKWRASEASAEEDFNKLDEMCRRLNYPLAVFINVASPEHHRAIYGGPFANRLHAFGVILTDNGPAITGG
jgi:hypothetical protein